VRKVVLEGICVLMLARCLALLVLQLHQLILNHLFLQALMLLIKTVVQKQISAPAVVAVVVIPALLPSIACRRRVPVRVHPAAVCVVAFLILKVVIIVVDCTSRRGCSVVLLGADKDGEESKDCVEDNLGAADEGEAHAEAEEAARVSNVGRDGNLLVLLEPLGVRVLDEDVEHDQVLSSVVQDGLLYRTVAAAAVGNRMATEI
jgi:hypothetical protein